MLKDIFIRFLFWATGSVPAQKFLEHNMRFSQFLMGIGSGGDVYSSGEKKVFSVLINKISAPYIIFDVGANRGQYLRFIQKYIPINDCQVFCFEPNKFAYDVLKKTAGSASNIHLNNIALSDHIGSSELWFDQKGSELASLTKRDLEHRNISFSNSEVVTLQTLDFFCNQNNIDHIHLLKMDIEGHEYQALQGAATLFEKKAIDMVSFEFGASNIDSRFFFKDFYRFMEKMGMNLFRITPSGILVKILHYNEIYEQFRPTNFLAIAERLQ